MITASEMRALEDNAEAKGISKLTLMNNAGKKLAEAIAEKQDLSGKRILVVCFHGNNGGDGFVAANELSSKAEVEVLFIGKEASLKSNAEENFKKLEKNDLVQFIGLDYVNFEDYDVIIDAMLGTGTVGELRPPIASVIDYINASKAYTVSADIPTGMHPDSGEILDRAIDADSIVCFHDVKKGLEKVKDKTIVVDIGIPKE